MSDRKAASTCVSWATSVMTWQPDADITQVCRRISPEGMKKLIHHSEEITNCCGLRRRTVSQIAAALSPQSTVGGDPSRFLIGVQPGRVTNTIVGPAEAFVSPYRGYHCWAI